MSLRMPAPISIISFCTVASVQIVERMGVAEADFADSVTISHCPGFSVGYSSAAAAAVAAANSAMARVNFGECMGGPFV